MSSPAIAARLAQVRDRIAMACERSGRQPDEVTLVAVTKTFDADVIRAAYEAGLRNFGENKAQEFAHKFEVLADELTGVGWHFVGHLQRNKVKLVADRARLIHGVESVRLARAIQTYAERVDIMVQCCIQVNVSGEESKFGLEPDALHPTLAEINAFDRVKPIGLMTLASPTADHDVIRSQFGLMRMLRDRAADQWPALSELSMGMSGDYEIAVEFGATFVRIGSALLGRRDA